MEDHIDTQVCRTCLQVDAKTKISLFKKIEFNSSRDLELAKMISELTKIKVFPIKNILFALILTFFDIISTV